MLSHSYRSDTDTNVEIYRDLDRSARQRVIIMKLKVSQSKGVSSNTDILPALLSLRTSTMASLLSVISCLLFTTSFYTTAWSFVKLKCPSANHGVYGQQSMLQCFVEFTKDGENGVCTIRMVTWKKEEKTLLRFWENISSDNGFYFAEPSWNTSNMNVSLLLTNTKLSDSGTYECNVLTDRGIHKATTSLQVTAKYGKPAMSTFPEIPMSIFCNTTGGHPIGRIEWFDEYNTNWTSSSKLVATKQEDGLFTLSSKYTIQNAVNAIKYRCEVYSANNILEGNATLTLDLFWKAGNTNKMNGDNKHYQIVAPVLVIGSLIAGLLFVLIVFKRRSKRNRRPSDAPLMLSHPEDDGPEDECMVETL